MTQSPNQVYGERRLYQSIRRDGLTKYRFILQGRIPRM